MALFENSPTRGDTQGLVTRILAGAVATSALVVETGLNYSAAGHGTILDMMTVALLASPVIAAVSGLTAEWSWASGNRHRAVLMAIAAAIITVSVLLGSMHRVAGVQDNDIAQSMKTSQDQKLLEDQLSAAIKDRDAYASSILAESQTGCGPKCQGWVKLKAEAEAKVQSVSAALAQTKAVFIADAEALHIATILHVDPAMIDLYKPVLVPIGLDLILVVGFGIAFAPGHRRRAMVGISRPELVVNNDSIVDQIRAVLKRAGRPVTNKELAELLGISEGESSKRVTAILAERPGTLLRERDGKARSIKLAC